MKRLLALPLLILGLVAATAASAGVYVETVTHNLATGTKETSQKMYVQGGQGRFVDPDGRATIIKNGTLYIINDAEQSYVIFDQATMETMARELNALLEQAKAQIAKLPPEQRALAEQQLSAQLPGADGAKWSVEVLDTGKSDKVDGRSCKVWDVKRKGELDEQLCVVPFNALPGKENFQAVFADFAKAFEEMAKKVPMLSGVMANEFAAQAKVDGFPVRSRPYENGRLAGEEELMSVWREENVPASMFEVPAGYKRTQMSLGGR